jgi:hypothetical protein
LKIYYCPAVLSLKGVETIPYLWIYNCDGIKTLNELENGSNQFVVIWSDETRLSLLKENTLNYDAIIENIPFFRWSRKRDFYEMQCFKNRLVSFFFALDR